MKPSELDNEERAMVLCAIYAAGFIVLLITTAIKHDNKNWREYLEESAISYTQEELDKTMIKYRLMRLEQFLSKP